MKQKKLIILFILLVILSSCKSKNVQEVERLIDDIGIVTPYSEEKIKAAQDAFNNLSSKEKEKVDKEKLMVYSDDVQYWITISEAKPYLEKLGVTDLKADCIYYDQDKDYHYVYFYSEQFGKLSNEEKLSFFCDTDNYYGFMFIKTGDGSIYTCRLSSDTRDLYYADEEGKTKGNPIIKKSDKEPYSSGGYSKRCKGCGKTGVSLSGGGYCDDCARKNTWKDSTDADVWWGY